MAKIVVFSKYFGYAVGGAERSTMQMLEELEQQGNQIVVLFNVNVKYFGAQSKKIEFPCSWEVRNVELKWDFLRFRYLEALLNRSSIKGIAALVPDADFLYSYGFEAPTLFRHFSGRFVYVIRDEYGVGLMMNYHKTFFAWFAYLVYSVLEYIPRRIWISTLKKALRASSAEVIANSEFMARLMTRRFGIKNVGVSKPVIDVSALLAEMKKNEVPAEEKGVVFVGDGVLKGADIFLKVAAAMPDVKFHMFSRVKQDSLPRNVEYHPWGPPGRIFSVASAVIVPSRWSEAFGRVAAEAAGLGVPVVVSNKGGLEEAAGPQAVVVDDTENVEAWVESLRLVLGQGR